MSGYFYTYKLTNVYGVSTQLLLNSNDTYYSQNLINESSFGATAAKGDYGRYVDNTNEAKVIQSYNLLSKVIDKLKDRIQVSYFIVGKVRTTEYFTGMPFSVHPNSVNSAIYEQRIKINIQDKDNYTIYLKINDQDMSFKGKFGRELICEYFNILIEKRGNFEADEDGSFQSGQFEFQIHSLEQLISNYQSGLEIENPDFTNILKVSCKDVIPARAYLFLDTLAAVYIDQKMQSKYDLNERTLSFIGKQMSEVSSILKKCGGHYAEL